MARQLALWPSSPQEAVQVLVDEAGARIEYIPDVLGWDESARLFARLRDGMPFENETLTMYDKDIVVPRLVTRFIEGRETWPDELHQLGVRVEAATQAVYNSVSLNLYRDGNDSVAWHNDDESYLVDQPTIALVSLGAMRRMHLRTKATPRRTLAVDLEVGSVIVMRGTTQSYWQHTIAKVARAMLPRISVAFRQRRASV